MQKTLKQLKQDNKKYYNDQDLFNSYSNPFNITKNQFLLILRTFNFLLIKSVIEEGKAYTLPKRNGVIRMKKVKHKGKRIVDFKHFNETKEIVYLKNLHSNGYIAQFFWDRTRPWVFGKELHRYFIFRWKLPRAFTRYAAKQIKEKNTIVKYYDY